MHKESHENRPSYRLPEGTKRDTTESFSQKVAPESNHCHCGGHLLYAVVGLSMNCTSFQQQKQY
jgi:hypothetical protein